MGLGAVVLTLHQQEEASGVLPEDPDGLVRHLNDGWIQSGVLVHLEAQISRFEQSWGGRKGGGSETVMGQFGAKITDLSCHGDRCRAGR